MTLKREEFSCPRCERLVTFEVKYIQFSTDETGVVEKFDDVKDYGQCGVARIARVPGHPIFDEIEKCPFFQKLTGK